MADRFGKFVVYVEERGERHPLCICATEADARGEVHEISMGQSPERQKVAEVGYREISMEVRTTARAARHNPDADVRFNMGRFKEEDFGDFDLYMAALEREDEIAKQA